MNMEQTFTCPLTGLEFEIHEDDQGSYAVHAITGERVPLYLDTEKYLLCIPVDHIPYRPLSTVSQMASEQGISRQAVLQAVNRHRFHSIKIQPSGTILIDRLSASRYYGE